MQGRALGPLEDPHWELAVSRVKLPKQQERCVPRPSGAGEELSGRWPAWLEAAGEAREPVAGLWRWALVPRHDGKLLKRFRQGSQMDQGI